MDHYVFITVPFVSVINNVKHIDVGKWLHITITRLNMQVDLVDIHSITADVL